MIGPRAGVWGPNPTPFALRLRLLIASRLSCDTDLVLTHSFWRIKNIANMNRLCLINNSAEPNTRSPSGLFSIIES